MAYNFKLPPHLVTDESIEIEPIFGKDDDFIITLSETEGLEPGKLAEFARKIQVILNEHWDEH